MILIVENDPDVADLLGDVCRDAGYGVTVTDNGKEAVEIASQNDFAMVMMDLAIHGEDGVHAAERIKALPPPFGAVPILVVTGGLKEEDMRRAEPGTFVGVIQKPFSRDSLSAIIRQFARPPRPAARH